MADPRIPASELGELREMMRKILARLDELEKPTGTQLSRIVDEVRTLVENLDARVQSYITAYSMTRAEVIGLAWMGVLPPGKGGTGSANAPNNIFTSGGPWNIIYGKTATGELGHAPSSARFKRDVQDAWPAAQPASLAAVDVDPMRVLEFPVQAFRYIDDVNDRGDAAYWHYGFVAEQLAEACLDMLLIFDAEGDVLGLAYERLSLLHHEVLRRLNGLVRDAVWRVGELEAQVASQQLVIDDLSRRMAAFEGGL